MKMKRIDNRDDNVMPRRRGVVWHQRSTLESSRGKAEGDDEVDGDGDGDDDGDKIDGDDELAGIYIYAVCQARSAPDVQQRIQLRFFKQI